MQCRGAASSLAAQLARLSLAASKLASILQLRGAAFVYVYYLVANGGGRQGPKNIGVATHKRRAKGARCERVPYCLSEGPFSSSMEKHCERPGSPSAQGGLLFFARQQKNYFRWPRSDMSIVRHRRRPLLVGTLLSTGTFNRTAPLFRPRRRASPLLSATLGCFPPLSIFGAPLRGRPLLRCCCCR